MVHLDDETDAAHSRREPAVSQHRRNDINRAMRFMLSKMRCRGHTLSCFLDELPFEFLPRPALLDAPAGADLVVNSSLRFQPRGEAPPEIRQRVLFTDALLSGVPLAWVEDPGTAIWAPLWLRDKWIEVIESLRPGEPAPAALTPSERQTLASANLLVPADAERKRRAMWEGVCQEAAAQLSSRRAAIVRDVIPPLLAAAMRRYYRALVEEKRLPQGDETGEARYYLHSEPVAMFLHPQLTALMSRIAGEPVKPSFLYFGSYPSGATLHRHVDRLQCEFSISLLVDYTPDPGGPCGWPLFLEHPNLPGGVAAADLAIGDGVFYRGREVVHYRHPLPEGHQSSSIFLNFVREDFCGDLL